MQAGHDGGVGGLGGELQGDPNQADGFNDPALNTFVCSAIQEGSGRHVH